MYIINKDKVSDKGDKVYSYYWLVESVRDGDKTRIRNLLYLGKINLTKDEIVTLGKLIERKITGKPSICKFPEKLETMSDNYVLKYNKKWKIFTPNSCNEKKIADYMEVDLNSLDHSLSRTTGSEILALEFWKRLGFDRIFEKCGFKPQEIDLAKAIIIGRLISPGSELHTYHWLKRETVLPEYLSSIKDTIPFYPLYHVGDLIYANKSNIEYYLRQNLKKLYPHKDKVFLYDLTNTYLESSKRHSNLCKRGKSKEKRTDCPLVTLALVVDQDGFPVYSKIYSGNQSEPATLQDILLEVYENQDNFLMALIKPAIIMDRGIATTANIDYLRDNEYSYFVIERRNEVTDFEKEFAEKEKFIFYEASKKEGIYLRQIDCEDGMRVLVQSTGKKKKEDAIINKKETRFLEDAEKLIKSNHNGYIKDYEKIIFRIGRLKERYGSIANIYKFTLVRDKDNQMKVKEIKLNNTKKSVAKKTHAGCYVIRTDKKDLTAKEIWDFYMNLTKVESSFRALKSELGTRPIYHQKDERIKAHLFISVLAYSLLRSITFSLGQKDYHKSWKEIRDILRMHIRSTLYFCNKEGYHYQIRKTGLPEYEVKELYELLDIKISRHKKVKRITQLECATQKKMNNIMYQ